MVVTKRPRPLWQSDIKRGTIFRSKVRSSKKKIFFLYIHIEERKCTIVTVVTKRPRPLWQKCYKKGYNISVRGSIPQKKKIFFLYIHIEERNWIIVMVVTKRPRPLWHKCYKKGYNL